MGIYMPVAIGIRQSRLGWEAADSSPLLGSE